MNFLIVNTVLQNALIYSNSNLLGKQLNSVIRANQGGRKPDYPFMSYLVTSKDIQNYDHRKEIPNLDPGKYSEEFSRKESLFISLSLFGKDLLVLYEIAGQVYNYLNIESKDFQREEKIKIELLNQIQDRSDFIEPEYEYRLGFDFTIKGIGTMQRTIDSVDIEQTINNVQIEIE